MLRDLAKWIFIVVVIVVVLVYTVLYATRMTTTSITLRADASELSFAIEKALQIVAPLAVRSLRVAGLSIVEIPRGNNVAPEVLEMNKEDRLGLMAHVGNARRDSLTIDLGSLPGGTAVWLALGDAPRTYKVFLRPPQGGEISVTAVGSVAIRLPEFGSRSRTFDSPRTIRLAFDRDTDLTIELRSGEEIRLSPEIPVSRLDLHRLPQHASLANPPGKVDSGVRPIPTLIGGTLVFDDLPDRRIDLYPGQHLFVQPIRDAQLLHVALGKDRVGFILQATVAGLSTGHSGQRNLMPDRLEYFRNQDWVKAAAGIIAALISLLGALANWSSRRIRVDGERQ